MKAIKSLILVLVAVLALASCSKGDGYRNVIPVNSPFVASVDMASIAEKSDFANSSVSGMIKQYMGAIFDGKAGKQVEKYMESPQDMGIDFRSPIYIFQTPNRCYGLTMKMLDKGDFEDFLKMLQKQNVASKAKERDGVMEGTLLDDIVYGYDDNTILILAAEEGAATSRRTLAQLFTLNSDDRIARTDGFSYCFDNNKKKDIAILSNMAALPQGFTSSFKSLIPQGVKMTDVQLEASADFQNGKLVLSGALVPTTEKACEMLREAEKNFHKINGDYLDTAVDKFPVWACMGVNGEWLLSKLKQDTSIKQMLFMIERGIDIEAIIRAIDGDVAVGLPSATNYSDFMVCGKLKNDDFLADVPDWQAGMKDYGISMNKKGDNYHLQTDDMNIIWGVKDKNLAFSTFDTNVLLNLTPTKANEVVKADKDEIKNSLAYMCVDLQSIITPFVQLSSAIGISPEGIAIMKVCSKFKAMVVSLKPESRIEIKVELDDDKENFLKTLLK